MAANILVRDVTISPNPVQAKGKYTISVSIEELKGVAFVGNYVGSYVNISDKEMEIPDKLPLAYVGNYTKG